VKAESRRAISNSSKQGSGSQDDLLSQQHPKLNCLAKLKNKQQTVIKQREQKRRVAC
jgi:hypothetical protein